MQVLQVMQVIPVIPVIPVSPVSPVSLAHLWVDFRVIQPRDVNENFSNTISHVETSREFHLDKIGFIIFNLRLRDENKDQV